MENELTLSEKLLLLAIRPDKGGIYGNSSTAIDHILLGAVFLELSILKNLEIKDKRIALLSEKTNSPLYDFVLGKIEGSSHPRKIGYWLSGISISGRKMRSEIYGSLEQKREIRLEDRRFLFFKWKKPYLSSGNHVYFIIDKIKTLISQEPDSPHDIYLLSLLEPAYLLRRVYPDRHLRKQARLKINEFQNRNQFQGDMQQVIDIARAVRTAINVRVAAAHASHA